MAKFTVANIPLDTAPAVSEGVTLRTADFFGFPQQGRGFGTYQRDPKSAVGKRNGAVGFPDPLQAAKKPFKLKS